MKNIAEAIEHSSVNFTLSLNLSHIYLSSLIQTLKELNLSSNETGDEGLRHLFISLVKNTVKPLSLKFPRLHFCFFTQTLTTLNLSSSRIGLDGIYYLAYAIQNNKV
jgi:hypothetical protein